MLSVPDLEGFVLPKNTRKRKTAKGGAKPQKKKKVTEGPHSSKALSACGGFDTQRNQEFEAKHSPLEDDTSHHAPREGHDTLHTRLAVGESQPTHVNLDPTLGNRLENDESHHSPPEEQSEAQTLAFGVSRATPSYDARGQQGQVPQQSILALVAHSKYPLQSEPAWMQLDEGCAPKPTKRSGTRPQRSSQTSGAGRSSSPRPGYEPDSACVQNALSKVIPFFRKRPDIISSVVLPLVTRQDGIGLRTFYWFIIHEASVNPVVYFIDQRGERHDVQPANVKTVRVDVFHSYDVMLKKYKKPAFAPFRRNDRVTMNFSSESQGSEEDAKMETGRLTAFSTTLCQLNFFRWAWIHGVVDYFRDNITAILEKHVAFEKAHEKGPI